MILARRAGDGKDSRDCVLLLHDPTDGTVTPLTSIPSAPIYAGQGKVIYARKDADTKKTVVYIADVKVDAVQSQPATASKPAK